MDALAYNLYDARQLICPMMDARRSQVYTGIYRFEDGKMNIITGQKAVKVEELMGELNALGQEVIFLGDGVPVYADLIREKIKVPYSFAPAHVNKQRAGSVGALGMVLYQSGQVQSAAEHQPEYLRVSQAERERAARLKGQKQV